MVLGGVGIELSGLGNNGLGLNVGGGHILRIKIQKVFGNEGGERASQDGGPEERDVSGSEPSIPRRMLLLVRSVLHVVHSVQWRSIDQRPYTHCERLKG